MQYLSSSNWLVRLKDFAKVLDSEFKPPPGFLEGAIKWLGNYDECIAISVEDPTELGLDFNGKYCTAKVGFVANGTPPINLGLGVCFPNGCSEPDVASFINEALDSISPNISFTTKSVTCQETHKDLSGRAIASIVLLSVVGMMLLAGTAYDVISKQFSMLPTITEKIPLLPEKQPANNNVKVVQQEPGRLVNILLSFSIYTNGKKLLSTEQGSGSLRAIHGIRFLSMTWIILGHTLSFVLDTTGNPLVFPSWFKRWTIQPIINGTVSVDSFFAISGLLLTYLTLNNLQEKKGKLNWFMFYFHRYWRLTPPLALLMLLYIPLVEYWGDGPLWLDDGFETNHCEDSWWRNLLYIQNLFPGKMCMGWTWYLADDMQFFIISPLIIIPLFMCPMVGYIVLCVFLLGTAIATGIVSRVNEMGVFFETTGGQDIFATIYVKPWCRLGAYLIGMLTGFILYKTKSTCQIKWFVNLPCWALATSIALAVIYGLSEVPRGNVVVSLDVAALYHALNRIAWAASLCWLIFACCTGNGGFINTILSWKALIPLSRMTYMAYLVHPIIIYFVYNSRRTMYYVTVIQYIFTFLGFTFGTYLVAFVLTLAFESPMVGLERVFLKGERKK